MKNEIIETYMTPMPHTINSHMDMDTAKEMMTKHHIRHLPVLNGGQLVGILSDRDISYGKAIKSETALTIEDIMFEKPYAVSKDSPVTQVIQAMIEHKYGCALISENNQVKGIFTTHDAMKLLLEKLI